MFFAAVAIAVARAKFCWNVPRGGRFAAACCNAGISPAAAEAYLLEPLFVMPALYSAGPWVLTSWATACWLTRASPARIEAAPAALKFVTQVSAASDAAVKGLTFGIRYLVAHCVPAPDAFAV